MKFELNKDGTEYTLIEGDDASTVDIPQEYDGRQVTGIGHRAFRGCTSLTSITIPDGVTSIASDALDGCPIETATIPAIACNSVKNDALKTVVITSGTLIGSYAFEDCTSLESVTIGNGVTSIGNGAFYGCTSLKSVYYNGDKASWNKIRFGNWSANPLCYGATFHTTSGLNIIAPKKEIISKIAYKDGYKKGFMEKQYKNLRDVRYLNGNLTQEEMAQRIGISNTAYSLIEKGKRCGSTETWVRIQDEFGLSDAEIWRLQKNIFLNKNQKE